MKRILGGFLLLCLLGATCSCGRAGQISPRGLFDLFADRYPLMAGTLYDSEAGEGKAEYLPPELFHALYSRPDGSDDREDIVSCVLYLGSSGTVWFEMAIFRCCDRAAVDEVASLCLLRCEAVRQMRGTPVGLEAAEKPVIRIYGTLLVFLALPDNAYAQRVIDRIL